MAEALLVGVLLFAGFAIVLAMDAHGKARAFEHGEFDPTSHRSPEAVTSVDLPPPHFNERDPDREESDSR
jgi:hypothetical protein